MPSFLQTIVAFLPLAAAAPFNPITRDSNPGCQAASLGDFAWTVDDFDFHASYIFTTPAHQNSWGYVNFNLSNPALTYQAVCSAASDQLEDFFYGTFPYTCTEPDGSTTSTTFDFSRPSGLLNINQTWVCSDTDPVYPTTFRYYGNVTLDLECTDTTWQNTNWTVGQIYSDREIKCNTVTVPVTPYLKTAVA
ncbi:hypothetical protein BX600DRAFT_505722 [Xylariales sp. PMI_506]|nr:hypothetical protein BX600DRAFT_505722 [Xylariales sp. PMI_506]